MIGPLAHRFTRVTKCSLKKHSVAWWHMSLIPALGRQRQVELCETEANMIHRASSSQLSEAPTEKQNRKEKRKENPQQTYRSCVGQWLRH